MIFCQFWLCKEAAQCVYLRRHLGSLRFMFYYSRKVKNTTEMQQKIVQCMEKNMSKVVCEVLCWRFFLDEAPWSGRPVEVDSNQIDTITENNQCVIPCRRWPTYSKYPNNKFIGENKNCL